MKTLPALAAAVLVSACAGSAPRKPYAAPTPPPGSAAIVFYRQGQMTGMALRPTITAGDKVLGKLGNHRWAAVHLPAGAHDLRAKWPGIPGAVRDETVTLHAEPDKIYFVRVRYKVKKDGSSTKALGSGLPFQWEDRDGIEVVEEAVALKQLRGMEESDQFGPAAETASAP